MSFSFDPLTSELPRAIKASGHYKLRRDGVHGLVIFLDYKDEEGAKRSMVVREDIWHAEDFLTHVDDLEEEMRIMVHAARAEFGS